MLHRGLEAIDGISLLFPGFSRGRNMLGLQSRVTEELRRDLQDRHDRGDRSHHRVARLSESMAAGNYSGIQRLVALLGVNRDLQHQLQPSEGRGVHRWCRLVDLRIYLKTFLVVLCPCVAIAIPQQEALGKFMPFLV